MAKHSRRALSRQVVIVHELGLHARSAARIAKLAATATAGVRVTRGRESADAASILDLLTLACSRGSQITVSVEDPADIAVLDRIVALVEDGFGEQ